MNVQQKLLYCLCINGALLIFIIVLVSIFADRSDKYFSHGPSDELRIMSVIINTNIKYVCLLILIMFVRVTEVIINEIAMPILGFNIYNPDKKRIYGFTRFNLQFYANAMNMINGIRGILLVLLSISQIDIAIWSVIVSECAGIYTVKLLLDEKTFIEGDDPNIESNEGDIEAVPFIQPNETHVINININN